MIHYTCDYCKQAINSEHEIRYVVRMEVYASLDGDAEEADEERDHLQEIQDVLESLDIDDEQLSDDVYQQVRYDLCSECRKRFLRNPLGRIALQEVGFSQN